ncbi:MAG: methyltransferase [Gammaproteobacteria bacterium]
MTIVSRRVLTAILSIAAIGAASSIATAADTPPAAAAPAATYVIPAGIPKYIRSAVESPGRSAEEKARDANRKPAEVLALSGVKPGDKVVEFASFGQYFTKLLSDIVGPKGGVYMYDLPYTEARSGAASRAFVAAHPNSKYELVDYNVLKLPENVDIVFNVLYYHDLSLNDIDTASLNKRVFASLKPGGIFFVVDHNAAPGSGTNDTKKLHRIDPEVIRKEVTAAGFELVEESKLLAHPGDDHTQIVFSPGLRGLTDQTIFKFRKPKK